GNRHARAAAIDHRRHGVRHRRTDRIRVSAHAVGSWGCNCHRHPGRRGRHAHPSRVAQARRYGKHYHRRTGTIDQPRCSRKSTVMKPRVLLTNPIHPEAMPRLQAEAEVVVAPDTGPDTLRRLAARADGLIVRAQLPADIFDPAQSLRAVVRHGVGLDMVPMDEANKRGIPVANVPGANTSAVVEYCIAAMLHLRRPIAAMDGRLRSGGWHDARGLADGTQE